MDETVFYMPKFNAICDVGNHPTEVFLKSEGGILILASPDSSLDTVNPRTIALHDILKSVDIRLLKHQKIHLMLEQHHNFHEGIFSDFLEDDAFLSFIDGQAKKHNSLLVMSEYDNASDFVEDGAYEKNRAFMQRNEINSLLANNTIGLVCIENLQVEAIPDVVLLAKEKKIPIVVTMKCPTSESHGLDGELMAPFFGWLFSPEILKRATDSNNAHILEMMETDKAEKLLSVGVKPEQLANHFLDMIYSVAVTNASPLDLTDLHLSNPSPDFYASEVLDFFTTRLDNGKHVRVPDMLSAMKENVYQCDNVIRKEMQNQSCPGHDFHVLPFSESINIMRGCAKERDLEITLALKRSIKMN